MIEPSEDEANDVSVDQLRAKLFARALLASGGIVVDGSLVCSFSFD